MTNSPLISIILPAYNAEAYIGKAIESVLSQSYTDFELLITDDASTDKTREVIAAYSGDKRIKIFHNSINKGYLETCNALFPVCSGELITFQDADDWSHPSRLQVLKEQFDKDKELGCAGSSAVKVNKEGIAVKNITVKEKYEEIKSALPEQFSMVGASLMIKKEVLGKIGYYDKHFDRIGSEHLHWFGKIVLNFKTINVPAYLYFYRDVSNSYSNNNKKTVEGQLAKELAVMAIKNLIQYNLDIFSKTNKKIYDDVYNYLLVKYHFWNDHFFTGTSVLISGHWSRSQYSKEKRQLFVMYFKKYIKSFVFHGR